MSANNVPDAGQVGVTYISYDIQILDANSANPEALQITLYYGATILFSSAPAVDVQLNGKSTTRTLSCSGSDTNYFVITLAPDSGYTTVMQGEIEVISTMAGVTINNVQVDAIDVGPTVIPLEDDGIFTYSDEGEPTANMEIALVLPIPNPPSYVLNGNGMIHVGIYTQGTGIPPTLVPIWNGPDTGLLGVKTFTVFIDAFKGYDAVTLAKTIVSTVGSSSAFLSSEYEIDVTGPDTNIVSVTNLEGDPIYIYIFDDRLLKAVGTTLTDVQAEAGVLPQAPDWASV